MSKYAELDGAILRAIKQGATDFTAIMVNPSVAGVSLRHEREEKDGTRFPYKKKPAYRFVDSRLQSLRKAGKIKYGKGGWRIAA